jgi:hypothetical protein
MKNLTDGLADTSARRREPTAPQALRSNILLLLKKNSLTRSCGAVGSRLRGNDNGGGVLVVEWVFQQTVRAFSEKVVTGFS